MTAGEMRRYFDYNSWANERMFGALRRFRRGNTRPT